MKLISGKIIYSMDTKWQITPEVLSSKIDEEVVLMSIEADAYFGLDPVGSNIWELLSKNPATINELVFILMEEYEVAEEDCRKDVQSFIDDMSSRKLIREIN
jgi:Coenzyme PQQ synthesis protein D (PqqD)